VSKLWDKRSDISQKLRKFNEILASERRYFGLFSRGAVGPVYIFSTRHRPFQDTSLVSKLQGEKHRRAKLTWTTMYATLSSDHWLYSQSDIISLEVTETEFRFVFSLKNWVRRVIFWMDLCFYLAGLQS